MFVFLACIFVAVETKGRFKDGIFFDILQTVGLYIAVHDIAAAAADADDDGGAAVVCG